MVIMLSGCPYKASKNGEPCCSLLNDEYVGMNCYINDYRLIWRFSKCPKKEEDIIDKFQNVAGEW